MAISKEYDDFEIEKDMEEFLKWSKIKEIKCKDIIEQMGKNRIGDQYYKKY